MMRRGSSRAGLSEVLDFEISRPAYAVFLFALVSLVPLGSYIYLHRQGALHLSLLLPPPPLSSPPSSRLPNIPICPFPSFLATASSAIPNLSSRGLCYDSRFCLPGPSCSATTSSRGISLRR